MKPKTRKIKKTQKTQKIRKYRKSEKKTREKSKKSKKVYFNLAKGNPSKNKFNKQKNVANIKLKSYSPSINKKLVSLKNTVAYDVLGCKSKSLNDSLLTVNIGTLDKPKCVSYNNKLAVDHLLKNLKASINLDCSKIIPPKQLQSNCWFNTMFMTLFISDKGRKFFRFFRQLMIEGKQIGDKSIPTELAKSFFMFNMAIEAAYNLNNNTKRIAYNFDTNLLIKNIYNSINNTRNDKKISFRNVGEPGNPLDYYLSIMNYLDNTSIKLHTIDFINPSYSYSASNKAINLLTSKGIFKSTIPHILVLEFSDYNSNNISDKEETLKLNIKDSVIEYKLDAIIIRDTRQQHFCSLLTCNGEEMSFDGASYSRMTPFKWKNLINTNKEWDFYANYDLKWNFRNGYQMLFYYRV